MRGPIPRGYHFPATMANTCWIWLAVVFCLTVLSLPTCGVIVDTLGTDVVDWEISQFGFAVYPVRTNPKTGVRERLENFEWKFQFKDAGMWAPRWSDDSEYGEKFPALNVSLINNEPVIEKSVVTSPDGTRMNRVTQSTVLHHRLDGKKFTMKMITDVPEADTWVEYVGYKIPVAKNGLKLTVEFEDYLTHNETTGQPLVRPNVYIFFEVTVKSISDPEKVNFLDINTYPLWLFRGLYKGERLPGYPSFDKYPTVVNLNWDRFTSCHGILSVRDDRVTVSLDMMAFSATNYNRSLDNIEGVEVSPDGIAPAFSQWIFWPKNETIAALEEYSIPEVIPPSGIRQIVVPIMYHLKTDPHRGYGNKIVWDPELHLIFGEFDPEDPEAAPVGAIAGGVIGGVIAVGAIVGVVIFIRRRRGIATDREKVMSRIARSNQTMAISTDSRSETDTKSSGDEAKWDKRSVENYKRGATLRFTSD